MFSDSIKTRSAWLPSILAVVAGAANWQFTREVAQGREPWDAPLYWQVSYPTLLLAAFLLGMAWRDRPWRWALLLMGGQAAWALTVAIVQDGVPNLLPLGFIAFAVLAVPCVVAAYAGKWLGEKAVA
jgi:peptidoglycan/LPS O-acetylase OafA/YrhL